MSSERMLDHGRQRGLAGEATGRYTRHIYMQPMWRRRWWNQARNPTFEVNYFFCFFLRLCAFSLHEEKGGAYLFLTGVRGAEGITSVFSCFRFACISYPRLDFQIRLDGLGIASARHEKE